MCMKRGCIIMDILKDFDFGESKVNLDKILKERNISKNKISKDLRMERSIIVRYCSDSVQRVDLAVMSKLCYYLNIGYDELLTYTPPKSK